MRRRIYAGGIKSAESDCRGIRWAARPCLPPPGRFRNCAPSFPSPPPPNPAHVQKLFTSATQKIQMEGEAEVLLAGRPFKIKKQFLDDIEGTKLAGKIRAMNKALLIFHSASDKTVGIGNARKIYEAARHPKSFISLDGADHLLSDKRDAAYVSEVLAAWAGKYLDEAPPQQNKSKKGRETILLWVVAEAGGSGFAQKIYNGKHELIADEPASSGGGNTGPTPYGYLLRDWGLALL